MAIADLDRVVDAWRELPEEDLNFNIQRALGCDYNYRYFGLTGIEFLEKLRDHLKA